MVALLLILGLNSWSVDAFAIQDDFVDASEDVLANDSVNASENASIRYEPNSMVSSRFRMLPIDIAAWERLDKKQSVEEGLAECGIRCSMTYEDDKPCNTFQYNKGSKVCARGTITPPMLNESIDNGGIRTFVKINENGDAFEECPESYPYSMGLGSKCCRINVKNPRNDSWPEDLNEMFLDYNAGGCSRYTVPKGESKGIDCPNPPCMNNQNRDYACEIEDVILDGTPGKR